MEMYEYIYASISTGGTEAYIEIVLIHPGQ